LGVFAAFGMTMYALIEIGMILSCATGFTIVNIDNGFSAAVTATLINKKIEGKSG